MRKTFLTLLFLFFTVPALCQVYEVLYVKVMGGGVLPAGTVIDVCAVGYAWTDVQQGLTAYTDGCETAVASIDISVETWDDWASGTAYQVNNVNNPTSISVAP